MFTDSIIYLEKYCFHIQIFYSEIMYFVRIQIFCLIRTCTGLKVVNHIYCNISNWMKIMLKNGKITIILKSACFRLVLKMIQNFILRVSHTWKIGNAVGLQKCAKIHLKRRRLAGISEILELAYRSATQYAGSEERTR